MVSLEEDLATFPVRKTAPQGRVEAPDAQFCGSPEVQPGSSDWLALFLSVRGPPPAFVPWVSAVGLGQWVVLSAPDLLLREQSWQ